MVRLEMLWTVRRNCPEGARFMFNCYKHWVQLLLHCLGTSSPAILINQERITHVEPFLVVLYGITLVTLVEELRASDPGVLTPPNAENSAFDRLDRIGGVKS